MTSLTIPTSKHIENYWQTDTRVTALKIASYLTEPICKVREYFYTLYILDETCKSTAQKAAKTAFLVLGIIAFSLLTPITAPIGALIRKIVATVSTKPYIYLERAAKGKILPENKQISLVSHNECYMPAGYCITDGQVAPSSDRKRIDANIQQIQNLNPDLICLYEVPDILDADYISSQLQEYPFIIPVAGVRAIGPSSMMYVASKYEIVKDSIQFIPFVKGTELTGRAQHSEKGVLSFDIKSSNAETSFATILSTHLQHSETPEKPEAFEIASRRKQMEKIAKQIQDIVTRNNVIFTGDLNQDEIELQSFLKDHQRDPSVQGKVTWGGDAWCAKLMEKPASGPTVLDYTFVAGEGATIATKIIETGYSGSEFRSDATSDHFLLFSTITVSG